MNSDELNQLREAVLRRELSRAEWERLRGHGDTQEVPAWAEEQRLTRLLNLLPDAPLSSNFTAQVLQAIDREPAPAAWRLRLRSWVLGPRVALPLATGAMCLLLLLLGYARYESARRERMVTSVASVVRSVEAASALAQLPAVDILRDYDAIQGLSRSRVAADEELLVALEVN